MKRTMMILLICCLILALFAGCKKAGTTAPDETGTQAAPEAAAEAAPAETTDIVRLENIDYDETTKGLKLSLTKGTYTPAAEGAEEYEYTISYGDTVELPLAADAMIDFPMADDLVNTVTITADELTNEFLSFVEAVDDKPLFTMEQEGDAVKKLVYFYLP